MPTTTDPGQASRQLMALAAQVPPRLPLANGEAARVAAALARFGAALDEHLALAKAALTGAVQAASSGERLIAESHVLEVAALEGTWSGFAAHWSDAAKIEREPAAFATAWETFSIALNRLLSREAGQVFVPGASGQIVAPPPTGSAKLDAEHARIFALIAALREQTAAVGAETIAELVTYAEEHFEREERLMEASSYPGRQDHRQEHHRCRSIVLGFRNDYLDGRIVDPGSVLAFFEGWLVTHIAHTDQAMAEHLRAAGMVPA